MDLPKPGSYKRSNKPKNMLIYGEPGTGKTTLASQLYEKTLLVSTDFNYSQFDLPAVSITSFVELMEVIEKLEKDTDFDCIIFDLLEDIVEFAREATLKSLGLEYEADNDKDYGQAWDRTKRAQNGIMKRIANIDKKIIFIMHAEKLEIKNRVGMLELQFRPNMKDKFLRTIVGRTQLVARTFAENEKYYVETAGENLTMSRFKLGIENKCEQDEFVKKIKELEGDQ